MTPTDAAWHIAIHVCVVLRVAVSQSQQGQCGNAVSRFFPRKKTHFFTWPLIGSVVLSVFIMWEDIRELQRKETQAPLTHTLPTVRSCVWTEGGGHLALPRSSQEGFMGKHLKWVLIFEAALLDYWGSTLGDDYSRQVASKEDTNERTWREQAMEWSWGR